jgi:ribose transport system permease protein
VILSLGIGAVYGLFNGVVTTKMRIQAFIVTLASMNIARGLARFWSNGIGIPLTYGYGPGLAAPEFEFFQARVGGVVPVPALVFLALIVAFWVVLRYTRFGRQLYAIGGNSTAAHLSGINVDRVKIITFMLCGMLSAVAGMLHSAQISQGGPNEGIGYELNAIAAVAIGGTSLAGGRGRLSGTLVGALIMGLLDNMLGLKGVNSNLQLVVKGLLIIVAVFAQAERKKE